MVDGKYTRPWEQGPARVRVSDQAGASADAQVAFLPGSVLLGSDGDDDAWSVAVGPSGNIYLAGAVVGATPGLPAVGGESDYLLAKLEPDGTPAWVVRGGTTGLDVVTNVLVGSEELVTVVGHTNGNLTAAPGGFDIFVARHMGSNGTRVGAVQLGGATDELVLGAGLGPDGTVCVTGSVAVPPDGGAGAADWDGFITWVPTTMVEGAVLRWGSSAYDTGTACVMDSQNRTFMVGQTRGQVGSASFGGYDLVLARYGANRARELLVQWGGDLADRAYGLALVSGADRSVVVVGHTTSTQLGGESLHGTNQWDCMVTRMDAQFQPVWTRLLGTTGAEQCWGVSALPSGDLVVAGNTDAQLPGQTSAGSLDAVLHRVAADGTVRYSVQVGTSNVDELVSVAPDGTDRVVAVGNTGGNWDGMPKPGGRDLVVFKFNAGTGERL